MATWTYVKRSGAPTGTITLDITNSQFVIDDSANTTIVTSDQLAALELSRIAYLTLQGVTGSYTPPPVIQDVFMADGSPSYGDRSNPTSLLIGGPTSAIDPISGGLTITYAGGWFIDKTGRPYYDDTAGDPGDAVAYYAGIDESSSAHVIQTITGVFA